MNISEINSVLSKHGTEVEEIRNELNELKVEFNSKAAVLKSRLDKLLGTSNAQQPLKEYVAKVLHESNEPLTVNEVTQLVLEAGYKTQSKCFQRLVFKALASSFNIHRATKAKTRPIRFEIF